MDERYGSKQPNAKDKKMVLTLTNISWVKGPTASSPAQLMRG
jgi:hypothetical protein